VIVLSRTAGAFGRAAGFLSALTPLKEGSAGAAQDKFGRLFASPLLNELLRITFPGKARHNLASS
jgi:hypothetical protein